jgi:hypothetical protein
MNTGYSIGDTVSWLDSRESQEGTVIRVYGSRVTRIVSASRIAPSSGDEHAYLIEGRDGDEVLKLSSELRSN